MKRRPFKLPGGFLRLFYRLWQRWRGLLLVIPYFVLLGWLLPGDHRMGLRPAEVYGVPDEPAWESPDSEHWFGTTGNGADLFELSRLAMAGSVSIAVVAVSCGIILALLIVMPFAINSGENNFELVRILGQTSYLVPSMVGLVILTGGSGGSLGVVLFGLALVIAFQLCPVLADWFEEGEWGYEIVAASVLGLSRREIVLNRLLPGILRRLIGVFASYVPVVVLVEMSLSYVGLTGDRLSCGAMIAYGQGLIIEAPWMPIYPGLMATFVVLALALLGGRVSAALRTGPLPRLF